MVSEPIRMVRHANGVEAPPERMDVTSPSFCAGFVSVLPTRVRMSPSRPHCLTHTRKDVTHKHMSINTFFRRHGDDSDT